MRKYSVDFRLFPDIVYKDTRFSNYNSQLGQMVSDPNVPLLRAYDSIGKGEKLLLIGDGSLGKSTSLRVLEAELLFRGVPCLFYECKSINANDIAQIIRIAADHRGEVLIFDAYDELQSTVANDFKDLIVRLIECNIQFILSSRFDPRKKFKRYRTQNKFKRSYRTRNEDILSLNQKKGKLQNKKIWRFFYYRTVYISDFTDGQLDSLISEKISRSSGYYKLIRNTMFLALHLEFEGSGMQYSLADSVRTEAGFIKWYLDRLYFDKTLGKATVSDLINLGKYVHSQRKEESKGKSRLTPQTIPSPLNHIFEYKADTSTGSERTVLVSNQIKYLNFLHGLYISDQLLSLYYDNDEEDFSSCAKKLLYMPSTSENSESLYYAGQLMSEQSEAEAIFALLNSSKEKLIKYYENVLCLFLGYNNDVADDIPGVFEFYHHTMKYNYRNYMHVSNRIRELRAASIKDASFGCMGMPQLESIEVDNDVFYSDRNCLIGREDRGVHLGCKNSTIPEGVTYIRRHAFSYCDIERVVIPSTVTELEGSAFKYCKRLEYVELSEAVNHVGEGAFHKCPSIKTLVIKNKNMQFVKEGYDLEFIEAPMLERAVVPTTAVAYVCKLAPLTLKYIEITQGRTYFSLEPLSFDGVWKNAIEELYIRNDVEYIAEDAFDKFRNNLERIEVEPGGSEYYSEGNCLISKKERSIVLGCKNSLIPKSGIRHIKNSAFARCTIRSIDITSDVESIGMMAFYKCFELETVRIGKSLKLVEPYAFMGCSKLKNVITESVDSWAQIFFSDIYSNPTFYSNSLQCEELADNTLRLSDGVPLITSHSFSNCCEIERVFIPSSVREICGDAFTWCFDIEEVHVSDINAWVSTQINSLMANPMRLGARLFASGIEVKEIDFANDTVIRKHTLARTVSIEKVTLNDGCTVEEDAFKGCPNLSRVVVTSKNVSISSRAFSGCKTTVEFCGTEAEWREISGGCELDGVVGVVCLNG